MSASHREPIPWDSLTRCQQGDSLLKFGRQGDPHFRNFKLSEDFEIISWSSKGKEQKVALKDVREGGGFKSGNLHGLFKKQTKKRYDARVCFSLDYTTKTLDLVCSDTDQYHAWSQAINYILKNGPPPTSERPESTKVWSNAKEDDDNDTARVWTNNDVYTWGFGGQGQLGHGNKNIQTDLKTPTIVREMLGKNVLGIACGLEHTVAIVKPGKLWAWGHGGGGRLGTKMIQRNTSTANKLEDITQVHELAPAEVNSSSSAVFVSVACGDYHTLGLTSAGQIHSWGSSFYGQLGRSDTGKGSTKVDDIEDIIAINASYTTSAAVSSSGALYTWGSGECGKLGHGRKSDDGGGEVNDEHKEEKDKNDRGGGVSSSSSVVTDGFDDVFIPRIVSGLSSYKVRSVACGDFHTLVSVSSTFRNGPSRLFSWGNNSYGQLGLGDYTDRSTPYELTLSGMNVNNIPSISCGAMHSASVMVLKTVGPTVMMWGNGKMGQLGLTTFAEGNDVKTNVNSSNNNNKMSNGGSSGGGSALGLKRRKSRLMQKIDSETEDGKGSCSKDGKSKQNEYSSLSAYCTPVPTKLMLHLARHVGSNSGNSSGTRPTSTKQENKHRGSVMGALHLPSFTSEQSQHSEANDHVGLMVGGGASIESGGIGMTLDPASVSCGANYTAIVLANTPAMRQLGMAGKLFVCGSNINGQLGQVRK
jgi:alpha-tubulin suppressor-like RCC1 family protein